MFTFSQSFITQPAGDAVGTLHEFQTCLNLLHVAIITFSAQKQFSSFSCSPYAHKLTKFTEISDAT
jgi:hypothetical protein